MTDKPTETNNPELATVLQTTADEVATETKKGEEEIPILSNNFPIGAQLGVLVMILTTVFGSLYYVSKNTIPKQQTTEKMESAAETKTPPPPKVTAAVTEPTILATLPEQHLQASAAYVWDVATQKALYAKNAEEPLPLASITKLMTALLASELIAANKKTQISPQAILQEGNSGLSVGEGFTVKQLGKLALIASSNDAAYELGASVGKLLDDSDPAGKFIHGMNIRAAELNLNTLAFYNTTGLDLSSNQAGAVGSARDVSLLLAHIITTNPELISPTQETATRVYDSSGAYHNISNTNAIVSKIPNLIGSKTGYTELAGGNLTIAFDAGYNRPIIITVLGSTYDARFTDVLTLIKAVQVSLGAQ